jgi:hypothetical protein
MKEALVYRSANVPSIWAWEPLMAPVWRYVVICPMIDLAMMQGVPAGKVHPICVMDDFGDLVRVPT